MTYLADESGEDGKDGETECAWYDMKVKDGYGVSCRGYGVWLWSIL